MKPIPTETATDVGSVGKWLGAAAAGALLMYLLDPERGSARRRSALSAVRAAGARTGATVDHALHNAGERLAGLKDSAASALSRGARDATQRLQDGAERLRERSAHAYRSGSSHSPARYDSYRHSDEHSDEPVREYGAGYRARAGIDERRDYADARADAARPGLLSLVRRSPGGLLVGLAGLALLWQGTRNRTYRVSDNMTAALPQQMKRQEESQDGHSRAPMIPPAEQSGSRYLH